MVGNSFQGPHRVWRRRQIDGGLAVSRAIGDTALESAGVVPQPDVIKQSVTALDKFVVMASDGVWDQLTNDQVVSIASQHDDPRVASNAIVKEARRRWERSGAYVDDITAMVIKM
jgi:serine/threonine protein phosphatase PrpC